MMLRFDIFMVVCVVCSINCSLISICVKALLKNSFRGVSVLLNGLFRKWPAVFCHSDAEECAMLVSLFPLPSNEQSLRLKWLSGGYRVAQGGDSLPSLVENNPPLKAERGRDARGRKKAELLNKADGPSCDNPCLAHTKPNPDLQKLKTVDKRGRVLYWIKKKYIFIKKYKRKTECVS